MSLAYGAEERLFTNLKQKKFCLTCHKLPDCFTKWINEKKRLLISISFLKKHVKRRVKWVGLLVQWYIGASKSCRTSHYVNENGVRKKTRLTMFRSLEKRYVAYGTRIIEVTIPIQYNKQSMTFFDDLWCRNSKCFKSLRTLHDYYIYIQCLKPVHSVWQKLFSIVIEWS